MNERSGEPRDRSVAGALALSVAFAALFLLPPLGISGAWDPYEIDSADLARRVAVHSFGATDLARSGDLTSIPTLGDLGMGELPITSMAFSFRLFGVHEWSGRLPLALFALAGVASLAVLMGRLVSGRAAFASVVALVTMPLFFLETRMMLGDAVTMAGFAMAIAGLALAAVETSVSLRVGALAWGALGLFVGFMSRGLLFGVVAPLVAVGLAGVACAQMRFGAHRSVPSSNPSPFGAVLLTAGLFLGFGFLWVALPRVGVDGPLLRVVGFALDRPSPDAATFDRVIRQLGHALFPWSAVLPVCLARLFTAPTTDRDRAPRESFARLTILSSASVSLLLATLVVPWAGALPFFGVAALAGAVGIAAHDLDGDLPASRVGATVSLLLSVVLLVDLVREPWRTLEGLTPSSLVLPPAFEAEANTRLEKAAALFLVFAFFAWFDTNRRPRGVADQAGIRSSFAGWVRDRRVGAKAVGSALVEAFQGNLVFVLVVVEAALVGLAATLYIGTRARWEALAALPQPLVSLLIDAWWAGIVLVVASAAALILIRDVLRVLRAKLGGGRGALLVLGGGLAGAVLSLSYYPALCRELSPASAYDTFVAIRTGDDELGLFGTSPKAGAFYTGTDIPRLADAPDAMDWLDSAPPGRRRFLLLRGRDLPRLNSLFRAAHQTNLPVLDARSSQTLLVSNLAGGRPDANPLADVVLDAPPTIRHPVDARFQEHIELLGWDLVDATGASVGTLSAQRAYRLRTYFRIEKPIPGTWTAFVHLDGDKKRQNADHPVAHGRYPMSLWQPGDIIVDEVELELDPSFLPGDYWLMCGFFQGETRLRVTRGPNQDDRVILGRVKVE